MTHGRHPLWIASLMVVIGLGLLACGGESALECPDTCELGCAEGSETCLTACTPQCDTKQCGDDGCGGVCGACDVDSEFPFCDIATGQCVDSSVCVPNCVGKSCGSDGCGGECQDSCNGECDPSTGICDNSGECIPICTNKECGDDGCGGECPDLCEENAICLEDEGLCENIAVPYAACQSAADTALFVEGGDTLHGTIEACGKAHRTEPETIETCLGDATLLSDHCIQCWASLMHCAFTLCTEICDETPDAPECNECMNSSCKDALNHCGILPDDMETETTE